jgi:hypothetical protein
LLVDSNFDRIGGENLDRADERWFGQRVSIHAEEERPGDALFRAVQANSLRGRQDMGC